VESGGAIEGVRIGLTGAGPHALRLTAVEKALVGKAATAQAIAAAANTAGADLGEINSDLHASAEYRRAMIPVFTRRALQGALQRMR
jgi:carbon-monoxide dehydrogenase medium subunit